MTFRRTISSTLLAAAALSGIACSEEGTVSVPAVPHEPPPVVEADPIPPRTVRLWFESASRKLVAETRDLSLPESDAEALKPLLQALLEKTEENDPKPVPDGIVVRATYLLPDGTAIVDLGGPLFAEGWKTGSDGEVMLVYSVVQTATDNLPSIKQVQLLVNGHPADTLAGHVSIERPLRPIRNLIIK